MRGIVHSLKTQLFSAANLAYIFRKAHPAFDNLERDIRSLGTLADTIANKYDNLQKENRALKNENEKLKWALKARVGR